jgi:hypothetical protein
MVHQNGTTAGRAGLPMVIEPQPDRPQAARFASNADFVSHLIAARHHLMPQRARRRETPAAAVDAYATGAEIAVRRMPAGYRTTRVV